MPFVALLLIAGCDTASTSTNGSAGSAKKTTSADDATDSVEKAAGLSNVTFYLAGMNKRLKIL